MPAGHEPIGRLNGASAVELARLALVLGVSGVRLAKTYGEIVVEGLDAAGILRQKGLTETFVFSWPLFSGHGHPSSASSAVASVPGHDNGHLARQSVTTVRYGGGEEAPAEPMGPGRTGGNCLGNSRLLTTIVAR